MKRVLVIGSAGAGKSTLARRLGELLGLEVIHLDRLFWHSGWVETPREQWRERVLELLARESWIMDGNYSNTFDLRFPACDTIIFLDLSRYLCVWRVVRRRLLYRRRNRPDMPAGCDERLDMQFIRWIWTYPQRTRPRVFEMLSAHAATKRFIHLRSPREVESFLRRMQREV